MCARNFSLSHPFHEGDLEIQTACHSKLLTRLLFLLHSSTLGIVFFLKRVQDREVLKPMSLKTDCSYNIPFAIPNKNASSLVSEMTCYRHYFMVQSCPNLCHSFKPAESAFLGSFQSSTVFLDVRSKCLILIV